MTGFHPPVDPHLVTRSPWRPCVSHYTQVPTSAERFRWLMLEPKVNLKGVL